MSLDLFPMRDMYLVLNVQKTNTARLDQPGLDVLMAHSVILRENPRLASVNHVQQVAFVYQ